MDLERHDWSSGQVSTTVPARHPEMAVMSSPSVPSVTALYGPEELMFYGIWCYGTVLRHGSGDERVCGDERRCGEERRCVYGRGPVGSTSRPCGGLELSLDGPVLVQLEQPLWTSSGPQIHD